MIENPSLVTQELFKASDNLHHTQVALTEAITASLRATNNSDGRTDGTMEHSNTGPTMIVPIVHRHQLSGLEWLFKHKELVGTAIVVVPLVAWLLWLLWYLGMVWKALITFIWTR